MERLRLRLVRTCLVVAAAILATPAYAQIVSDPDVYPDWLKRPSSSDLAIVWPMAAIEKGVGGKATIHCKLSAQGALFDCKVLAESPANLGFGAAAIALTPQMTFKPALKDGKPVVYDGVRIPVNFNGSPPRRSIKAQRQDPKALVATGVRWSAGPSYEDVAAVYPPRARAKGLGGQVALRCSFGQDGGVKACTTIAEHPKALGFSAAARSLTPLFKGPTHWPDGTSIEGARVDLKFAFTPEMLDPVSRPVAGKPQWLRLPTGEQLSASFPEAADKALISQARTVLACTVLIGGHVGDCRPVSEDPAGYGFGEAALALSRYFLLAAWSDEGLPTIGGEVRIPIRYDFGERDRLPAP
jgi:TonB family protein